jgi:hypothetical protein
LRVEQKIMQNNFTKKMKLIVHFFFTSFLFSIVFQSYSQIIIQEKILQKKDGKSNFYSQNSNAYPEVFDGNGNEFALMLNNHLTGVDLDLNILWKKEMETVKSTDLNPDRFSITTSYKISGPERFYDINIIRSGKYIKEIAYISYSYKTGETTKTNIIFEKKEEECLSEIFANQDGLFISKIRRNRKTKEIHQYLEHIDHSGKLVETTLELNFKQEELTKHLQADLENIVQFYSYRFCGVKDNKIYLYKRNRTIKTTDKLFKLDFSIYQLDNKKQPEHITSSSILSTQSLSQPTFVIDTLNNIIYGGGYLMKTSGFSGIYLYSYNLTTKIDSKSVDSFSDLSTKFKLNNNLDELIMYAELNTESPFNYKADINIDFQNKLALFKLVPRNDLVLKNGYTYLYYDNACNIYQISKVKKNKGNNTKITKEVLYQKTDSSIESEEIFLEKNNEVDNNRVTYYFISRNNFSIMVTFKETNSLIKAQKIKFYKK